MKKVLHKIAKIISNIIFWILIVIVIVLAGYMIVIRVLEKQGKISEVPINMYTILSQSMYPTIKAGDIVITYQIKESNYLVGDIITFMPTDGITNGVTITHRIVEKIDENGDIYYKTKGDNNATADITLIPNKNVAGKYIFKIPKAGFIQQFLVSKTGWIIAIVIPSLAIIIYDIVKLFDTKALKRLKKSSKNVKEKKIVTPVVVDKEAKEDLKKIIETDEVPKQIEEQLDDVYEDLGISDIKDIENAEEEIENLFDEEKEKENDNETEIL